LQEVSPSSSSRVVNSIIQFHIWWI
jgi:hypothetical protein